VGNVNGVPLMLASSAVVFSGRLVFQLASQPLPGILG
jgi:hypothetical protein